MSIAVAKLKASLGNSLARLLGVHGVAWFMENVGVIVHYEDEIVESVHCNSTSCRRDGAEGMQSLGTVIPDLFISDTENSRHH